MIKSLSPRVLAIIKMLIVMLIWGSSFAVTRYAVASIPPACFAFLRFASASLFLSAYLLMHGGFKPVSRRTFLLLVCLGATGITLFYTFFNFSLVYTSASMGALLQGIIPVAVAILSAVFLKQRIGRRETTGILISVMGVVMISITATGMNGGRDNLLGNALMFGAVIAWAVYTVIAKRMSEMDSLLLTTYSGILGTILLIPVVLVELHHQPLPTIPLTGWLCILYLGLMASALGYLWYNESLKHLSATEAGTFINLDPVIGVIIAMLFLGESISLLQIAGGVLILGGVWLGSGKKE